MSKLGKKQVRERIETYLAGHPGATSAEIGKALGVSKQRAHMLLKLLRIKTSNQLTEFELELLDTLLALRERQLLLMSIEVKRGISFSSLFLDWCEMFSLLMRLYEIAGMKSIISF